MEVLFESLVSVRRELSVVVLWVERSELSVELFEFVVIVVVLLLLPTDGSEGVAGLVGSSSSGFSSSGVSGSVPGSSSVGCSDCDSSGSSVSVGCSSDSVCSVGSCSSGSVGSGSVGSVSSGIYGSGCSPKYSKIRVPPVIPESDSNPHLTGFN